MTKVYATFKRNFSLWIPTSTRTSVNNNQHDHSHLIFGIYRSHSFPKLNCSNNVPLPSYQHQSSTERTTEVYFWGYYFVFVYKWCQYSHFESLIHYNIHCSTLVCVFGSFWGTFVYMVWKKDIPVKQTPTIHGGRKIGLVQKVCKANKKVFYI